jgi:hypothetical protein
MSANKMIVPGFGTGSVYGTPRTIALDATATVTLTGTVLPAGQYMVAGIATGVQLKIGSGTNGVTETFSALDGAPGFIVYDGVNGRLVNTTTSVTIRPIAC